MRGTHRRDIARSRGVNSQALEMVTVWPEVLVNSGGVVSFLPLAVGDSAAVADDLVDVAGVPGGLAVVVVKSCLR